MVKPKVVLERKRDYVNRLPFYIYLDDKKIGVVPFGRTVVFDVEPGTHTLQLKAEWLAGSPVVSFTATEGEVKTYSVSVHRVLRWLFPLMGILFLLYVVMRISGFVYTHWLSIASFPVLAAVMYFAVTGRKRYLELVPR